MVWEETQFVTLKGSWMQSWCITKEKENKLNLNPVRTNAGLSDRDKKKLQGFGFKHEIKDTHNVAHFNEKERITEDNWTAISRS